MANIGTTHEDMIHDASLDYYGKRLATCSSDKTIKIFEIEGDNHRLIETLRGHEGPVWQVAWAHPKFGSILASASYDGRVLIWREDGERWSIIAQHTAHQASVNSVEWAPHELGALLLCGSSDGCVSVVEFQDDGKTESKLFPAHAVGCNAVAWAPTIVKGSLVQTGSDTSKAQLDARRFATGGCDNLVKIWQFNSTTSEYDLEDTLEGHSDWVRDVAWAPSVLPKSYIASASQDKTVQIWTKEGDEPWKRASLTPEKFSDVLWRVSWSFSGNVLAVSGADNKVTLWRENLQGEWKPVGSVEE